MTREEVLQAEVAALRAEIQRLKEPPVPGLSYYDDIEDVVAQIRDRGVHPTEGRIVAEWIEGLRTDLDALRIELRDATTFKL
jgi:hypothetical protein